MCSSVEFLNLNVCCLLDTPWLHLGPHSHHALLCFILKTQWGIAALCIVSQTSRLVLFLLVLVIFSCPALRRVMPLCRRHLTLNSFYCFHKFCMIHISSWLSPTSLWYSISPCATWLALSGCLQTRSITPPLCRTQKHRASQRSLLGHEDLVAGGQEALSSLRSSAQFSVLVSWCDCTGLGLVFFFFSKIKR